MEYSASILYMLLYILAVKGDGCPPPRECVSERECAKRLLERLISNSILYECGNKMVCCIQKPISQKLSQTPVASTGLLDNNKMNLLPENCGEAYVNHIVNGENAEVGEFPWMVLINITDKNNNQNRFAHCGGSLINENYVLTAAHCIYDVEEGYTLGPIIMGEYNTRTEQDCNSQDKYCADPIQIRSINAVITHENYGKPSQFKNDIALIKLNEKVNFNGSVSPICLPIETATDETVTNYEFTLAGWGKILHRNEIGSSILQKGQVTLAKPEDCNTYFDIKTPIDTSQICMSSGIKVEACYGDSGGPLMDPRAHYRTKMFRWHVIGIVSSAPQNNICGMGSPTVYVKVEKYIDWILEKIEP